MENKFYFFMIKLNPIIQFKSIDFLRNFFVFEIFCFWDQTLNVLLMRLKLFGVALDLFYVYDAGFRSILYHAGATLGI